MINKIKNLFKLYQTADRGLRDCLGHIIESPADIRAVNKAIDPLQYFHLRNLVNMATKEGGDSNS